MKGNLVQWKHCDQTIFHISMILMFTMNIFRYLKCVSNESVPLIPHTMELFDQVFVWSDLLQKNKNSSFMMMR